MLNDTECPNLDVSDTILTCDAPDLLAPPSEGNDVSSRRRRQATDDDSSNDDKNIISKSITITVCRKFVRRFFFKLYTS